MILLCRLPGFSVPPIDLINNQCESVNDSSQSLHFTSCFHDSHHPSSVLAAVGGDGLEADQSQDDWMIT